MKSKLTLFAVAAVISVPASAYDYTDEADVLSAVPVYENVAAPLQQCWTESVTSYEAPARSGAGGLIGGVAGGLLGAQVGKGNGRIAAAAAGAAIGAIIGDRMSERHAYAEPVTRHVERCRVSESYRQVLAGYEVTYRYRGRIASVMLPYDPGPSVRIGVEVADGGGSPAAYVIPPVRHYRPVPVTNITFIYDDDDDWKRPGKKHKHKHKHKHRDKSGHWY